MDRSSPERSPEATPAFAELLDDHLDALYSAARRMCRSAAEAEELVQETCLSALKSFGQLHSERKARAWLFAILHHRLVDRRRREKREPHITDIDLEEAMRLSLRRGAATGPPAEVELGEAFSALEESFRLVVWLSDAEGFTSFEIARILDLPQGTVASRLFRGRRQLRTLLRSEMKP